jgi:hypothetical protein
MQIYIELAARLEIEKTGEGHTRTGIRTMDYRFDTRCIWGDYTTIQVPLAFDNEQCARLKLYEELTEWHAKVTR